MSDIRFNQWLHNSGTGGVSQVDGGHVGIGTTNPLIPVGSGVTAVLNVGVVTANYYYGDGSNLSGVQVGGASSLSFNDNIGAYFGNSQDLKIHHDGNHSYIDDQGQGNLRLRSGTLEITNLASNKTSAIFSSGGGQTLNFNNSTKFVTTNTGVVVTGIVTATKLQVNSATNTAANFKGSGGAGFIQITDGDDGTLAFIGVDGGALKFQTSGSSYSDKVIIDTSGRLFLGTTTAGESGADDLTIENTSADMGITLRTATNRQGTIMFSDATSGVGQYAGAIQYAHGAHAGADSMKFLTNSTVKVTIDSGGRVLINTTNTSNGHISASNLAVQGGDLSIFKDSGGDNAGVSGHKLKFVTQSGSLGEIDVLSEGAGGPSGRGGSMRFYTKANNTASADERLRINSSGMMSIGKTSNAGKAIEIYQGSYAAIRIQNSSTGTGNNDGVLLEAAGSDCLLYNYESANLKLGTAGTERIRIDSSGHTLPGTTNAYDLGSSSLRWRNVYTTDLQLSNEGKSNDVDGTWGDYTIQEGESELFLINNRSGKKYVFLLKEVS